ncbi:murein biosynthesis integral membrane protein MurJ [Nocardiopsis mangrovi]|uniref:Murein biosynthesis integral membrane protein MurJ n=1 Tax=Nocardiopsis mangrovi TaxID=1179818 RepID=A0ABV9DZM2_9ACTN
MSGETTTDDGRDRSGTVTLPHAEAPSADQRAPADESAGAGGSVLKSSAVMAVGTTASRITGFARTIVLAAALGTQLLGDAYNTANTIPFIVYDLLIGGLMASVIVPFLVKRRRSDADGGTATEQRLFTGAVIALLALTVTAVLAAEALIRLYAGRFTPEQFDVAVLLARYLLAQIFFVGVSGLSSAMLNTRNRFGAPVWAPVLNNLVIICVGATFIWTAGTGATPDTVTDGQIALLGLGTTGGLLLQAAVVQFVLWRSGFRWRPRLDLRGSGLGEALKAAGWMFVLVCAMQTGFLITANLANRAGVAMSEGAGVGGGLTAYNYAYQLFQLPYAIIAVSVITVLLPRMSAHAAEHDWAKVRGDFSRGLRMSSVVLVPIGLALAVYAVPLSVAVFARGSTSVDDARVIGSVLTVFALGLIPFTVYQLMLRVFYAMGDTRTPALIAVTNAAVHGTIGTASYVLLPSDRVLMGIAAGFMLSYLWGLTVSGRILSRRLGGLDGWRIGSTIARLYSAALPCVAAAVAVQWLIGGWSAEELPVLLGGPLLGCAIGAPLFLATGHLLRVDEIRNAVQAARKRLPRRA